MNTKIICCYHRGAPKVMAETLTKYPEIFVPVLGGAHYYKPTDTFFDHIQKDNDGKNISYLDVHFSEHTQLYWAYKNQDKLGYPDMIGLCHYRRFMDVDYNNLDPNKIYLRRDPTIRVQSILDTVTHWIGLPITQWVLDDFLYHLPEYKEAVDSLLSGYKFFDKNMFIMNKMQFNLFMEYLQKCYRICLDARLWDTVVRWFTERNDSGLYYFLRIRGVAFLLEMFSAIYFEHLFIQNYPVVITKYTKDSFDEY